MTDSPDHEIVSSIKRLREGSFWIGGAMIANQVVRFAILIGIAAQLGPSDFGAVSIGLIALGMSTVIFRGGMGDNLVQRRVVTDSDATASFGLALLAGLFLALALLAAKQPATTLIDSEALGTLLPAVSLTIVFQSLTVVPRAILTRGRKFESIARIELSGTAISGLAAGALLITGRGIAAFCVLIIAMEAILAIGLFSRSTVKFARVSGTEILTAWKANIQLTGSSIANQVGRSADQLLIGSVQGAASLGIYSLAYKVVNIPTMAVVGAVNRSTLPTLAKHQTIREDSKRVFLEATSHVANLTLPVILTVAIPASITIPVFLGEEWAQSVILVHILGLNALRQAVQSVMPVLLISRGMLSEALRWAVITNCIYVTAFLVGLEWGTVGVAASYTVAGLCIAPSNFMIVASLTGCSVREYFGILRPHCAAAGLASGLGIPVVIAFSDRASLVLGVLLMALIVATYVVTYRAVSIRHNGTHSEC